MNNDDAKIKISELEKWFKGVPGTITAFSGGVDSTLVLYLSHKFLGDDAMGCISISPSLKRKDYAFAIEFCEKNNIPLEVIETQEVFDQNYSSNPANRCYFCKNHLYHDLQDVKSKFPEYHLLNGINSDDYGDYRPGIQAAMEYEIRSPLAECNINKHEVRALASYFGLPNWDKPASPCLSSRVPYGSAITIDKLKQIENAEEVLNEHGFSDVRVRHYGNEAKIEVPEGMIEQLISNFDSINESIKALGFDKCIIDEEGLVSGKLNRSLNL